MRNIVFLLSFFCSSYFAFGSEVMPRVPAHLFVHMADTNFTNLFKLEGNNTEDIVRRLFEEDRLNHEMSKAYDVDASFDVYWRINQSFWHSLDLNKDGKNELLFASHLQKFSSNELFEIYELKSGVYQNIYSESGHLLAFKIHPNTKEIILYHHKYPCCSSGSHNLNRVRFISGKIILRKKYFVGFDKNAQGDFFPKKCVYKKEFSFLKNRTKLRWSNTVVTTNAAPFSNTNVIAEFDIKTAFKVLYKKKKWSFVLMYGTPLPKKEGEGFLNTENFKDVHIYGWICNQK